MAPLLRPLVSYAFNGLVTLLLPPVCVSCRASVQASGAGFRREGALCAECFGQISFIAEPCCDACGVALPATETALLCSNCRHRPPAWSRGRSTLEYDDGSKRLILAFKHADRTDLAPTLAAWMARAGHTLLQDTDAIVPVPLHRWRLYARRYNQAALLARALAKQSGIACVPDALLRTRATRRQDSFGRQGRQRNLAGAIVARASADIVGKRLLLIDDVMTSGATLSACALALYEGGAAVVDVLTLARVTLSE